VPLIPAVTVAQALLPCGGKHPSSPMVLTAFDYNNSFESSASKRWMMVLARLW